MLVRGIGSVKRIPFALVLPTVIDKIKNTRSMSINPRTILYSVYKLNFLILTDKVSRPKTKSL